MDQELKQKYVNFLKAVINCPGYKYPTLPDSNVPVPTTHTTLDETGNTINHFGLWEMLERQKLIKCVGSYKWKPTEKLEDILTQSIINVIEQTINENESNNPQT